MIAATEIVAELRIRGVRAEPLPHGGVRLIPARLIDPELFNRIRKHKAELLAYLRAVAGGRAAWACAVAPDSRRPLIPPEVRSKIEDIEPEARAKGWPPELLWNGGFWDCPRGLAAVLDAEDEIAEVREDYIAVLKVRRDLLQFRRHAG